MHYKYRMILIQRRSIVTLDVLYYMPDYSDIVQEFLWQTLDVVPELPRVHRFLNYWKVHIEAPIKEIQVSYSGINEQRVVEEIFNV